MAAAAGVKGRTISLKLKRRKTNAPDPPKFMGHGDCDNMSRSVTLSRFTDSPAELASQGKALLKALRVDPTQIRGIGLNVRRLDLLPIPATCFLVYSFSHTILSLDAVKHSKVGNTALRFAFRMHVSVTSSRFTFVFARVGVEAISIRRTGRWSPPSDLCQARKRICPDLTPTPDSPICWHLLLAGEERKENIMLIWYDRGLCPFR